MSEISSVDQIRIALGHLAPAIGRAVRASIGEAGIHSCSARAALAKSFEFTKLVYDQPIPAHGFFLTATLRGICEDLIALSFMRALSEADRDEVTSLLMAQQIREGVNAQKEFFASERQWQPVLGPPPGEHAAENENRLRGLAGKLGWTGRQNWPSVWFMAKATSLEPVYRCLYSATSKWVHYSPHVLLRMGWGGREGDLGSHTEWTFSTTNFGRYYTEFNQTYALLLLLRLLRGPVSNLLPPDVEPTLLVLEEKLQEPLRWPELVTFEEMNLNGPPTIARMMMKIGAKSSRKA